MTEDLHGRYARRPAADPRYSILRPDVWMTLQERQRALLRLFADHGVDPATSRLLEVGCGEGGNLLELLQLGFRPAHLAGIELLPARAAVARERLPAASTLHAGDALRDGPPPASQDIVFAATVFSSLLEDGTRQAMAARLRQWLRSGGAVLWYDFTLDNPRNPDVRGVPRAELAALFPGARIDARRVTLAPPLARAACRVHPALYTWLNAVPGLRTHLLAWITFP